MSVHRASVGRTHLWRPTNLPTVDPRPVGFVIPGGVMTDLEAAVSTIALCVIALCMVIGLFRR